MKNEAQALRPGSVVGKPFRLATSVGKGKAGRLTYGCDNSVLAGKIQADW
jgi:hypothetical protein